MTRQAETCQDREVVGEKRAGGGVGETTSDIARECASETPGRELSKKWLLSIWNDEVSDLVAVLLVNAFGECFW